MSHLFLYPSLVEREVLLSDIVLQDAAGAAASELVLFLSFSEGEGGQFILQGPQALVAETGKQVAELLQGKGGGRGNTFQGRAGSFKRRNEVVELLRAQLASSS